MRITLISLLFCSFFLSVVETYPPRAVRFYFWCTGQDWTVRIYPPFPLVSYSHEKVQLLPRTPQQRCFMRPVIEIAVWGCRILNSKTISTAPGVSPFTLPIHTERYTSYGWSLPLNKSADLSNYPQLTAGQFHSFISSSHEALMPITSTSCVALIVISRRCDSPLCIRHQNLSYYPGPQPDSSGTFSFPP